MANDTAQDRAIYQALMAADIVSKLSIAIADTLKLPETDKRLADFTAVPAAATPSETAAFIKAESNRWRELIDTAGLNIN